MPAIKFSQLSTLNTLQSGTIIPVVYNGNNYKLTVDLLKGYVTPVWSEVRNKPTFAEIAFSGDYAVLVNKPTIPTKVSQLEVDVDLGDTAVWSSIIGKPTFATVATSGSYADLINKPNLAVYVTATGLTSILSSYTTQTYVTSQGYITTSSLTWNNITGKPAFATVSTSGSYTHLTDTPVLATVATSGRYGDLSDKPLNLSNFNNDIGAGSGGAGDRLINGDLELVLDSSGTLQIPLLLPTTFTAVLDSEHMIDAVGFTDAPWEYEVTFACNPDGTVETQIDGNRVWPVNPGYVNGYEFEYTEADHGIPGYTFTITINPVNAGPAGWGGNIAVSPPPAYPSTVESLGAIKLTADENNWTFGTDGLLTLPSGTVIGNVLVLGTDGIVGTTGTGVGVSAQGNSGYAAIQWIDDIESIGSTSTQLAAVLVNSPIASTTGTVQIVTGVVNIGTSTFAEHTWEFGVDGALTAPGHILPNIDRAYDLGSTSSQWRSIYVGTGTVYIGGVALGVNQDNYVTVDGNPIITVNTASGSLTVQGNTNIVLGSVAVSATAPAATTTGSQWYNSLDGRTYIAYNGQWVDASPTIVPPPETYLDQITTISGDRLVNGNFEVVLDASGNLTADGDIKTGVNGGRFIQDCNDGTTSIRWTRISVNETSELIRAYTGDTETPDDVERARISVEWQNSTTTGVSITAFDDGANYTWDFRGDGTLTLPDSSIIHGSLGSMILRPSGASTSTQALLIYPTVQDGNHIHLTSGGGDTDLYLGNDDQFVKVDHSGTVVVQTYSTATTSTWTFGTDGVLTLPAATPVIKGGGTGTDVTVVATTGSNTSTWVFAADGTLTTPQSSSIFALSTDFTGTIIGGNGTGGGYIRVESNTGAPNFSPAPIGTSFHNFLLTLTAGKQFTIHTVVDGTTYDTVVSFTEFGSGTSPAENANRSDLYFTKVSGDELPFSYSATELTLTFTSNSIVVNPESITFPDATVQTTAYLSGQQTVYVNTASTVTNIVLTELTGSIIEITPEDGYTLTGETHNVYLPFQFMGTNPNIPLGTRVTIINKYDGPVYVGGWPDFGFPVIQYASVDMVYHYDRVYGGNVWWVTNSFVWD